MTSDDLKRSVSMRSVVEQYGIVVNRANMCCCPFHGERHPSMKIYKDSYYCFACHENGDIFSFVQKMDNCDFKTAFIQLGGEYSDQKQDFATAMRIRQAKNTHERRLKAQIRQKDKRAELFSIQNDYMVYLEQLEPFSDEWCSIQNDLTIILGWIESNLQDEQEVETNGVISRYKQFKQERNSLG